MFSSKVFVHQFLSSNLHTSTFKEIVPSHLNTRELKNCERVGLGTKFKITKQTNLILTYA